MAAEDAQVTVTAMMEMDDVLAVMDALTVAGVDAWLDGGWGVDALLGEQTRAHEDLDLVISLAASDAARRALAALGYTLAEDARPTRFVVRDGTGDRQVDCHTVTFDDEGGGIQQLPDGAAFRYPSDGFTGDGRVAGRMMPCLSAPVQVRCHLGYAPDENDRRDVLLLCQRFTIPVPALYTP